jgi:hypothetical protein
MLTNRTTPRLAAAGVIAAALTGCTVWSSPAPTVGGPLGAPGDPGELCAPADRQGRLAYGFLNLASRETQPVTLEELRLLRPHGLTVVDAFVMPIRSRTLYGTPPGWLDVSNGAKAEGFGERQGIPGATVVRSDVTDTNLVVNLLATSPKVEGRADGLEIRYRDHDGDEHLWQSPIAIRVMPTGADCS